MRKTGIITMITIAATIALFSCSDKQDTETPGVSDSTAATMQEGDQMTTTPSGVAADSLPQQGSELIGLWVFAQGENMVRISYRPDGTFFSESFVSTGRLLTEGKWDFDGTTLTNIPTRFTVTDSSDAAAVKEVQRLNDWIAADSTALMGHATIAFEGTDKFNSTSEKGQVSVYHRLKAIGN